MVGKRPVESDNGVSLNVRCSIRRAVMPHVALARIHRPYRVGDLPAYKIFIRRFARAQCDIGLSFGKIEIAIAHHELDANFRVFQLKLLQ
ncbi:hypothetical protein AJ87_41640 [Rhizobium yanglingense]|nr:hypothetical protein AJ87_41640 [Rhizobium yanglingense]